MDISLKREKFYDEIHAIQSSDIYPNCKEREMKDKIERTKKKAPSPENVVMLYIMMRCFSSYLKSRVY